jgi:hypothetical protein
LFSLPTHNSFTGSEERLSGLPPSIIVHQSAAPHSNKSELITYSNGGGGKGKGWKAPIEPQGTASYCSYFKQQHSIAVAVVVALPLLLALSNIREREVMEDPSPSQRTAMPE